MTTRGSIYDVKVRTDLSVVKTELAGVGDAVNRLTRDMGQRFSVVEGNLQRVADTISRDVLKRITELDRKIEGLGSGKPTKAMEDSFHQLAVTIKVAADALETLDKRTRAMEQKATTARANVLEQRSLQRFRRGTELQIEQEKRLTAAQRFEQRKQIENLKQADSLERIAEQANQQKRLARWQSFYKTIGQFGQQFAATVGRNAGQGLANIFRRESDEFSKRERLWRRGNQNLTNIEEVGSRSRLNVLGRYFDKRRAKIEQSIAKEQAVQRSVATQAVNDRLNTGVLGSTIGATSLGGLGGAAVGVGLAGGLVKAFNVSSDFAASMEVLRVASGATEEQINRVREAARKFGNDVRLPGLSAADAADAFRILATSGIDLETSLGGAAESVLQLSRAAKIEAADAAKAVSAGINVFGISAKDTAKVADGLSVALTQSGASAFELNDALKQAGLSFANKFKEVDGSVESFQQLNGVLAIFAKNGLRGSDAGTSLKTMLQFLGGKSVPAVAMLRELAASVGETGTVLYDAEGATRSFADVLRILRDGINKLPTDEARGEFISKVFGTDASRAAEVLAALNDDALPTLVGKMNETGAAARLASAQNQGYKRGLDALLSTLETISLMLAPLGDLAGAALEKFSGLLTNLAEGDGVWKALRTALYGAAAGLGAIVAAKGAVEVFKLLRVAAMGLMSSPFGLFSVVLTTIGGAIGYLVTKSPSAIDALKGLGDSIKKLARGPFEFIRKGVEGIVVSVTKVVGGLTQKIGPAISNFTTKVTALFSRVRTAFLGGAAGGPVVSTQYSRILAVAGALGVAFTVAGRAAGDFVDRIRDIVSGSDSLGGKIQSLASAALGLVGGAVGAIWEAVSGAFDDLQTKVWPKVRKGIQDGWTDLRDWIGQNVPWADKNLLGPVERFITSFRELWQDSFGTQANRGVLGGILNFIEDGAKRLGRTLTAILTDPKVLAALGALLGAAAIVALKAVQGFLSGVIDKLADRLQSIFKEIPIIGGLLSGLAGFGEALSSTITAALIAGFAFSKLKGPLGQLREGVANTFRGARMAMLQVDPADVQALQDLRTRAAADVRDAERARVNAINDRRLPGQARARMADQTVLNERAEALAQRRFVARQGEQRGQERLTAALRLEQFRKVEEARRSADAADSARRSANVREFGRIGGGIANLGETARATQGKAREMWAAFSDRAGSAQTRRLLTERLTPIALLRKGMEAARVESQLLQKQEELRQRQQPKNNRQRTDLGLARREVISLQDETKALFRASEFGTQRVGRMGIAVGRVWQQLKGGVRGARAELEAVRLTEQTQAARNRVRSFGLADTEFGRAVPGSFVGQAVVEFRRVEAVRNQAFAQVRQIEQLNNGMFYRVANAATRAAGTVAATFGGTRLGGVVTKFWERFREGPGIIERTRQAVAKLSDAVRGVQPDYVNKFLDGNGQVWTSTERTGGLIQKVFGTKYVNTDGLTQRFGGLIDKIGGVNGAVQTAETALGAFFGGQMLAGDGLTSKIAGVLTTIGSIGAAFAVGGPIAGGIATVAAGVGLFTAQADKAKAAVKAWADEVSALQARFAEAYAAGGQLGLQAEVQAANKRFIDENSAALTALEDELPQVAASVRSALTLAGTTGDLQRALDPLRQQLADAFGTEGENVGTGFTEAFRSTLTKETGQRFSADLFKGFTSRRQAEAMAGRLRSEVVKAVRAGAADKQDLFDQFFVVEQGGGKYEIVRKQIKGLGDESSKSVATVQAIGNQLLSNYDAYRGLLSETGQIQVENNKTEEKRLGITKDTTGAIKDQTAALETQRGILGRLQESFKAAWREARGETGSGEPSTGDLTGNQSSLAENARAITKDAREAAKAMVDALTVDGKVGTLTGKLTESQLDQLDDARGRLSDAWSEILAGAAANPELQKDWEGRGKRFLESMLNQIMESARKNGLSAEDQKRLLTDLKIPEFADIQSRVVAATEAQIDEMVGKEGALIQAAWDEKGPKLLLNIKVSEETLALLRSMGYTVTPNAGGFFSSIPGLAPFTGGFTARPSGTTTPRATNPGRGGSADSNSITTLAKGTSVNPLITKEMAALRRDLPWVAYKPGEDKPGVIRLYQAAQQGNMESWEALKRLMYRHGGRFPETFAYGDIVDRPTLGIFGEAGGEVILPLTKPARMAHLLGRVMTSSRFPMADLARLLGGRFGSPFPRFANGAMFTSNGYRATSTTFDNSRSVVVNEGNIIVQGAQRPQQTADAILRTRKGARYRSGKGTW